LRHKRVCGQVRRAVPDAEITIATSKAQVSVLRSQLGDTVDISVELCRRDTFPAIALVSAYLHDVKGVGADEAVVVCPVDPYVEDAYFVSVRLLGQLAAAGTADLMLMGIAEPDECAMFAAEVWISTMITLCLAWLDHPEISQETITNMSAQTLRSLVSQARQGAEHASEPATTPATTPVTAHEPVSDR